MLHSEILPQALPWSWQKCFDLMIGRIPSTIPLGEICFVIACIVAYRLTLKSKNH